MTRTETARIDSIRKASRYLSGLGESLGFEEALRRIESHATPEVGSELNALSRWVTGAGTAAPNPALALIADVVRYAPEGVQRGRALGAVEIALADARALADHLRSGLAGSVAYAAALLGVAGFISLLWLVSIAPQFAGLFEQMGAELPGLSQAMVDWPWAVPVLVLLLALVLGGLVLGTRQLAIRIETMAPLGGHGPARLFGPGLTRAHARWRALALARAWKAGGGEPLACLRRACDALDAPRSMARELEAELALADGLGAAAPELDYQTLAAVGAYRDSLEIRRAAAIRLLQIAIALLVGVIVIAIYLPIFKMGAVV